ERAEDAAVAADVAEAVPEVNRSFIRLLHSPLAKLAKHARKAVVAPKVLGVERGEVLREALADPLLMIVAPSDRLTPPLVSELVRDEEFRIVVERRRVVSPDVRGRGERLVEGREISRTVAAGKVALDQSHREARIRIVVEDRFVEFGDVAGALAELAAATHLPRIGEH